MNKIPGILLFICISIFSKESAFSATTASQTLSATLTRHGGGGGGGGSGGVVAITTGAAAATGISGAVFAPLLLAGLSPNTILVAAAPLCCIPCQECFLQTAITNHFGCKDYCTAIEKLNNQSNTKFFWAQNDSRIFNGTYDMHGITLPPELLSAKKIRINVTIASSNHNEVKDGPEISCGLYRDITQADLRKKFETQQFRHYYMMKKYNIPMRTTLKAYSKGLQKISGTIDIENIKIKDYPLQVIIKYTEGGFQKNQSIENPKIKSYAYLLEVEKLH